MISTRKTKTNKKKNANLLRNKSQNRFARMRKILEKKIKLVWMKKIGNQFLLLTVLFYSRMFDTDHNICR